MATYLQTINTVLGKLRKDPISALSTDNTTDAYRVQTAVQRAIARIWNAKQWTFKQSKTTLSLTSGTAEYKLPRDVGEPYIVLSDLSPYWIRFKTEEELDSLDPNPTASANPRYYTLFEYDGVETQPSSASALSVVSSSASDTSQIVVIRGLVSGYDDYEEITVSGTSPVSTTKSFSSISSVSKSGDTAGRITVTAGATTCVVLGPLETNVRLRKIRFYPTPTATTTISIKHYKAPVIPVVAHDVSGIPSRWDYVVDQYAFALALQSQGKDQSEEFVVQMQLAKSMLDEDMAGEEKQESTGIIVPNRALDVGSEFDGMLRSSTDGLSFEE